MLCSIVAKFRFYAILNLERRSLASMAVISLETTTVTVSVKPVKGKIKRVLSHLFIPLYTRRKVGAYYSLAKSPEVETGYLFRETYLRRKRQLGTSVKTFDRTSTTDTVDSSSPVFESLSDATITERWRLLFLVWCPAILFVPSSR